MEQVKIAEVKFIQTGLLGKREVLVILKEIGRNHFWGDFVFIEAYVVLLSSDSLVIRYSCKIFMTFSSLKDTKF